MYLMSRSSGEFRNETYTKPIGGYVPSDYITTIRVYGNNTNHICNNNNYKFANLSSRLRDQRIEEKLTQNGLARRIMKMVKGNPARYGERNWNLASLTSLISAYETNRCTPKLDNLTLIAHALGVSFEYLTGWKYENPNTNNPTGEDQIEPAIYIRKDGSIGWNGVGGHDLDRYMAIKPDEIAKTGTKRKAA